jgi:hypothetical protein
MFRKTILTLAASAALGMAALAPTIASADGMNDRKDYGGYDRRDYDRKDYDRKDYGEYDRKDDYQGYGKGYQYSGHPHYGYKVISKPWYVYKPAYVHKPWFAYKPHDFHRGYKFGGWNYGKYGYHSY